MLTVHGNSLGPLALTKVLGRGGMGLVWNASSPDQDQCFAVKLLAPHLNTARSARARFEREAAILSWLRTDGVVRLLDRGETEDGIPFVVMNRAAGRSLDRFLHRKKIFTVRDTVKVLAPVLSTLAAVHRAGVIHRDIKPGNIMVHRSTTGIQVTLIDFGVAGTAWDAPANDTQVVGTLRYMSPEQAWKVGTPHPRDDLWAVAVVAYECLTGHLPFDGPTEAYVFYALDSGTFKPASQIRPDLPPEVDAFFARAFSTRAKDRFGTCEEMRNALLALPWQEDEEVPESCPRSYLAQSDTTTTQRASQPTAETDRATPPPPPALPTITVENPPAIAEVTMPIAGRKGRKDASPSPVRLTLPPSPPPLGLTVPPPVKLSLAPEPPPDVAKAS